MPTFVLSALPVSLHILTVPWFHRQWKWVWQRSTNAQGSQQVQNSPAWTPRSLWSESSYVFPMLLLMLLLLLLSRITRVQLCDRRDGSPPGSPVPGILQARTLEWVAISFSNRESEAWTTAYQAPLSMGFSRQECWSGVPLPSSFPMLVFPKLSLFIRLP